MILMPLLNGTLKWPCCSSSASEASNQGLVFETQTTFSLFWCLETPDMLKWFKCHRSRNPVGYVLFTRKLRTWFWSRQPNNKPQMGMCSIPLMVIADGGTLLALFHNHSLQNDGKNTLYHEFTMILTGIFLFYLFWRLLYPFLSTSAAAFRLCSASDSRSHLLRGKSQVAADFGGFGVQSKNWFKGKAGKPWKPREFWGKSVFLNNFPWISPLIQFPSGKIWRVKGCDTENNPPKKNVDAVASFNSSDCWRATKSSTSLGLGALAADGMWSWHGMWWLKKPPMLKYPLVNIPKTMERSTIFTM